MHLVSLNSPYEGQAFKRNLAFIGRFTYTLFSQEGQVGCTHALGITNSVYIIWTWSLKQWYPLIKVVDRWCHHFGHVANVYFTGQNAYQRIRLTIFVKGSYFESFKLIPHLHPKKYLSNSDQYISILHMLRGHLMESFYFSFQITANKLGSLGKSSIIIP